MGLPELTLDQIKQPEVDYRPEAVLATVLDFYSLNAGMDQASLEAHTERALTAGRAMDAKFTAEVLLPRLNAGENVHLVIPVALRAALWLADTNAESNTFMKLQNQAEGRFQFTYLPVGVTRHRTEAAGLDFYKYYPDGRQTLADHVTPTPDATVLVRSTDFGGASGVSMAETTRIVMQELAARPENTYIDTVVASDHALGVYERLLPKGNARRMLAGAVSEPNFWIVGVGQTPETVIQLADRDYSPKDWGQVCTGMEDFRDIYGIEMDDKTFKQTQEQNTARFFGGLRHLVALNSDPLPEVHLAYGGQDKLLGWYHSRFTKRS
jgi:hypothetical protein